MATADRRTAEQILADRRARNAAYQRNWRLKNPKRSAEIAIRSLQKKLAQAEKIPDSGGEQIE